MSFMKRVLKIGLPIAASLIPGIGPLAGMGAKLAMGIGSAAGAAGGLLNSSGGKSSSGSSNAQTQQNQLLGDAITKQQGMSQGLIDTGKPLVSQGSGMLGQSGGYYSDILKGGASQDKALAGPISDLKTGSQAQLNNMSQFAPRGNIAGKMSDRTSQLGSQIARLRYGAMGDAATGLSGVGSSLLGQGTNLMTTGTNSFQQALQTLLGKYGVDTQAQTAKDAQHNTNMGGLGEGIGSLLSTLLSPGGLLNKTKSGGKP